MTTTTQDTHMTTRKSRPVLTRADIGEKYGYGLSTLERWWRERALNGHPPAVPGGKGNVLQWDAEEWAQWDEAQHPPAEPRLLTRRQLAQAHGLSNSRMDLLWANRERNGHPPVHFRRRRHYWDADEWARWYEEYSRTEPRWFQPATATTGRDGDAEIGPGEFARILGHASTQWVSRTVASTTPPPGFPAPISYDALPSGRRRPKWRRRDAEQYATTRATTSPERPGRPKGSTGKPHPYADDPRLQLARTLLRQYPQETTTELTRRLEATSDRTASPSTWTKILAAARRHPGGDEG